MLTLIALVRREALSAWRNRWIAIAFAWVFCAVGWTGVMLIPNQYEADARLYVDADAVLGPLLRGIAVDSGATNQVDMLQRTLLSRPNLEKLVSSTDLELGIHGPNDRERLIAELPNQIKVQAQSRDLFTIAYRSASPKLAYDVVRTLVTTYVESSSGNNRSDMENAQQFLEEQIASYERQLHEAEGRRAAFRAKYVDLLPSDTSGTSRLEAAETLVNTLRGQLQDAQGRSAVLKQELAAAPAMMVAETDPGSPGGGNSQLAAAEQHLNELRLRYTDQHPDVIAARQRVEALRSGGGDAPDTTGARPARSRSVPNPLYEQLKVRVIENDEGIVSLQRQVADATKERDRLAEIAHSAPGLQAEYLNINRDYDVLRKNYEELLARRESMRISAAAATSSQEVKLRIVDPPQMPRVPASPKRLLLISGVLLAGVGGGLAAAVLLTRLDASFHSVEQLQGLGLPVIGGISMLATAVPLRRRLFNTASVATALLLLCVVYAGLLHRILHSAGNA